MLSPPGDSRPTNGANGSPSPQPEAEHSAQCMGSARRPTGMTSWQIEGTASHGRRGHPDLSGRFGHPGNPTDEGLLSETRRYPLIRRCAAPSPSGEGGKRCRQIPSPRGGEGKTRRFS